MSNWPKISIVTASYNQGEFLEQTIQSVLDQNYPNLEYIIIDGASTDQSVEIIKKYADRLTYWVSEEDRGQSHAINKGIERCTGDVFNWLNSDDYLEPGILHKIGEAFKDPNVHILAGKTHIINETNGEDSYFETEEFDTLAKTISRPNFFQPAVYLRKSFLDDIGLLTESLHYAMDTEMYTKYLLRAGIEGLRKIDDVVVHYRIHEESKTGSQTHKFFKDINSIFYSIAQQAGDEWGKEKISKWVRSGDIFEDYHMKYDFPIDEKLWKSVVANYIYKYVNLYYGEKDKDFGRMKALVKDFPYELLEPADQEIMKKIALRLKFSPILKLIG